MDRSGQRQPVRRGAYQAQLPRRLEAARHADVISQNHFVRPSAIELARIAEARNGRKKFSHFVKPGAEPNKVRAVPRREKVHENKPNLKP